MSKAKMSLDITDLNKVIIRISPRHFFPTEFVSLLTKSVRERKRKYVGAIEREIKKRERRKREREC